MLNNLPEGHGEKRYRCGDYYIGEWSEGKHDGKGHMTYNSGNKYEG